MSEHRTLIAYWPGQKPTPSPWACDGRWILNHDGYTISTLNNVGSPTARVNGFLLAAAPDLLEALIAYVRLDHDQATGFVEHEGARIAECHALAAKALAKAGLQLTDWLAASMEEPR